MRIVAISDLHGTLPDNLPEGDILIIAGDICPVENHGLQFQHNWLDSTFRIWLTTQLSRYSKVAAIAGNHDFIFEFNNWEPPYLDWIYLQDSLINIKGINIYGAPWQPIFHNWAFNLSEKALAEKWAMIPDDTDILVTHGPPFGILDWAPNQKIIGKREHAGSITLMEKIWLLPNLKHHIFGHLHSNYGQRKIGDIMFSNVSILDEGYHYVNSPTIIDV